MSKFETSFKAAIADSERRILITTLRSSPELTLGEIHKISKGSLGRLFSEITIAELLSGDTAAAPAKASRGGKARGGKGGGRKPRGGGEARAEKAAEKPEGEGKARRAKPKAVNTRTPEGRANYDEALFQALEASGGPTGAGALIAKVGGTSLQARAGLARLIEAGRITWSGKARGTKYSVA
jgi:hypothetical protein